jgi:translocation and assembly module TamB
VNLTGNYDATADIDSQTIQLGPLLQTFLPEAGTGLLGQTEFHAKLKGPLKNPDQVDAQIEIPSFQIGYPSIQLAATGPIHADYRHSVLNVARAELKGTGTDVTLQASIPLGQTGAMHATADGKVDLQLLQIWNPQWKSSGQLNLQLGVQGTRSHPEMNGTIAIADGAISIENVPTLEKMRGELNVTSEAIQIKTFTGKIGGGDFEVHGSATYRPGMRYNLGMTTKDVRLLYPDGVRTQLTAALNFIGDPNNSNLTGQVTVDRLSLTQSFDLGSLSNQFGGPVPTTTGFAQNVKLNITLNTKQELELASSQLSIQGNANLQVRGTLAEPVLLGRTNLTGGEFFFNGRRFTLQNASIQFANPVRTAPTVNLTATTVVNQFNLTINLVGPFDRLRTTYTSDPPLAPVDVINLLITGQTTEAAQSNTSTPQSVIAGQLAGQVSDRLQKFTGISSLTIDPQIGGNQGNGASQLAIQERVTKNLFFTFATDVTTTQGQVVQVEYQITKKYSMSAIRDQTGGYEVEIKSHKTF